MEKLKEIEQRSVELISAHPSLTFAELGLSAPILQAVEALGFEHPTPIQALALPALLKNNKDYVVLAQTGTGKTAAYGLPLAQLVRPEIIFPQALVLAPTRELCIQITEDFKHFNKYQPGVRSVAIYGGAAIKPQLEALSNGAQLVVATPGRLIDIMDRGKFHTSAIEWVVLDEADEMLRMGFREELNQILAGIPQLHRTWLFSATMLPEIRRIASQYMQDFSELSLGRRNAAASNISHYYYLVKAEDKYAALKRIVDYNPEIYGLIFCRTKAETQQVADQLLQDGYNADALHGDLSQPLRDTVMNRFRSRSLQLLVCTDVAARGIDVDDITHVIHYGIPEEAEIYTHRSGRTARAGKSGESLAIITARDQAKIHRIEQIIGDKIVYQSVPLGVEVCRKRLLHISEELQQVKIPDALLEMLPEVRKSFDQIPAQELVERFLAWQFNQLFRYYEGAVDLNVLPSSRKKQTKEPEFETFKLNIGRKDRVEKPQLLRWIMEGTGIPAKAVGRLSMQDRFSTVEINERYSARFVEEWSASDYNKRRMKAEPISSEAVEERPRRRKRRF